MGQRLVITVQKDNKDIATIYYHWSAYSVSALMETKEVLDCLLDDLRLRLIRFVENRGGCIDGGKDSDEYKVISRIYPNETFKEDGSRNDGLIDITAKGMQSSRDWSEGDVYINLDNGMVFNSVFWVGDVEEYDEEMWKIPVEKVPEIDINIEEIPFENLDKEEKRMGNRAVITTRENFDNNGVGVYLHWNGGRDSVEAFLKYCELKGYREPDRDNYGWARLCQVIGNYFNDGLSVGIDVVSKLDCDNYDNGVYIIKGWEIVGRKYFNGIEQNSCGLRDRLLSIDASQPESIREIIEDMYLDKEVEQLRTEV